MTDPRLSPARGDLAGLPPLHVQVGTRELLLDDAKQLADKASAAGVEVRLDVCDDMIHIWPVLGAGVVPEAQDAIERMAAFAP
jgi:acetyl esterase/lipase